MRGILISMLLLITVLILYQMVAKGDDGMNEQTQRAGGAVSDHIRGMSP